MVVDRGGKMKQAYIPIPVRGKAKSFFMAVSILLAASLTCGAGVGLAFRCSLYTFYICLAVISPLVLMALCGWATHRRLYRGARSGMAVWPLLKYAVQSNEYRVFGPEGNWLGKNALFYGNPWIGPWDPRE
jgi:hypothetical protein